MRKLLHIIALILVAVLALCCIGISSRLPTDAQSFVAKKYAGWSGVLRAWVSARWSCEGSFIRWLNACAADFERVHNGVYVEFTSVREEALREIGSGDGLRDDSSLRAPELIFFSPNAFDAAAMLEPLALDVNLKRGLICGLACPVAMGGYIAVANAAAGDIDFGALPTLPDDGGRCFSLAALCFADAEGLADGDAAREAVPDAGIDIGLPASAAMKTPASLEEFVDGTLPALIVSQKELGRLMDLRDSGRGPEWRCLAAPRYALADQLLLAGVPQQSGEAADARGELAAEFLQYLLGDDAQRRLADIGAFPATNVRAYSDQAAYGEMERGLWEAQLVAPNYFSEYPPRDIAGIVRDFHAGALSPGEALRRGLTETVNSEPIYNR